MSFDLTRREAEVYLAGLLVFLVGTIGIPVLGYHQTHAQLHGAAALLLLIPFTGVALVGWVGHRLGERTLTPFDQRPPLLVSGFYGIALLFCLGVPTALSVLRRGR